MAGIIQPDAGKEIIKSAYTRSIAKGEAAEDGIQRSFLKHAAPLSNGSDLGRYFKMDVLSFINSNAIREHLRDIGYGFNSLETAWLIYSSQRLSYDEKKKASSEQIY